MLVLQLAGADVQHEVDHAGALEVWSREEGHNAAQVWVYTDSGALCLAAHEEYCLAVSAEDEGAVGVAPGPSRSTEGMRLRGTFRHVGGEGSDVTKWELRADGRIALRAAPDRCLQVAHGPAARGASVVLGEVDDRAEARQLWLFDTSL